MPPPGKKRQAKQKQTKPKTKQCAKKTLTQPLTENPDCLAQRVKLFIDDCEDPFEEFENEAGQKLSTGCVVNFKENVCDDMPKETTWTSTWEDDDDENNHALDFDLKDKLQTTVFK